MQTATPLPQTGYLRLADIVGSPRQGKPAILPVSRSTFLSGVKSGRYPLTPIKLSERCTAYAVGEVRALIDQLAGVAK
jgi:hypothetical protein